MNYANILRLKEPVSQMSMVWRLESSWICLGCGQWLWYLLLLPVKCYGWFYVIIRYILFSMLSWPMISTQYLCLVLTPTCMFLFVICGVQQMYYRLRLVRNSSQSPAYQNSEWATDPSSCWILSFTSWCLEFRTWTSFYLFSFLILLDLETW